MVMGVRGLVRQVEPNPLVVSRLTDILEAAGFGDATDVAMIDAKMVGNLLGKDAEALGGALRRTVTTAGPILEGWVTNINRVGRASGGGAGEGLVLCQVSTPPVPCPERAPRKPLLAVGPVGAGGEASGPTPSVHRAVRLLRGFTKYTLSNKTPLPAAPPEVSVADLDRIRIEKAKARIHQVMLRYFPSCRRLSRLRDFPTGDDYGAADGDEHFPEDGAAGGAEYEAGKMEEGLCVRSALSSIDFREPQGRRVCSAAAERNTEIDEKEDQRSGKKRVVEAGKGNPADPGPVTRKRRRLPNAGEEKGLGRAEKSQNLQAKDPLGPSSGTNDKCPRPKREGSNSAGHSPPGAKQSKLANAAFLFSTKEAGERGSFGSKGGRRAGMGKSIKSMLEFPTPPVARAPMMMQMANVQLMTIHPIKPRRRKARQEARKAK